jgi:hypothetical protein
MASLVA